MIATECSSLSISSRPSFYVDSDIKRKSIYDTAIEEKKCNDIITILGFGSLLSERSARCTFPELMNFRLGYVPNYRRVFGHVSSIFFKRNIANKDTMEMSSVAAEPCEGSSFLCSVFEVENRGPQILSHDGIVFLSENFVKREEVFDLVMVPYFDYDEKCQQNSKNKVVIGTPSYGILCTKSTDYDYKLRWGSSHFENQFGRFGMSTIWDWGTSSNLKPCAPYLRHCVLAAQKLGQECYDSFLDETYLVDRKTTIRQYLCENPSILKSLPPPELSECYGG